ncbi:piezo-type mechanosensitive ion channel component isoform X3 [Anabrus simplex]|uniref:piezo-type mechanosensitive ion channel component isoform X3 n=1 Tax=Anabrus simplex TaxID=316456 RepID=UPI0035A3ACCD
MANYFPCLVLIRLVLPLCLATCVLFRQNLLSFIYLLLFFYIPWVYVPTVKSMAGATGRYLQIVMVCSILTSIAQLSFQIVLLSMQPYGHFLENCNFLEKVLRHIGLIRLDGISGKDGIRALAPEALMLVASIVVYVVSNKLVVERRTSHVSTLSVPSTTAILPTAVPTTNKRRYTFLVSWGKYIVLLSLCLAGVMRPSIPGSVYFIAFLGGMTWWACYKDLGQAFAVVIYCVMVIVALHIISLFGIQLQWIQELVTEDCNYCRYLGLTPLAVTNCTDPRNITYVEAEWASYINPIVLLWLYFILCLEGRLLIRPRLIRGVSPSAKYTTSMGYQTDVGTSPGNVYQDALGSVTITDGIEDMQLETFKGDEEPQASVFEQVIDCISAGIQLLHQSSYILTNIIMMAWSITYHSWLTFVLLLWASVLWMIPNQRRAMLYCSPLLVFYAECLLIIQYIYGMDLTDAELPQEVEGVDMKAIGIYKPEKLPCEPLMAKSLYTIMFWITLRQFMQERFERRSTSALQDMAAPLQVSVNTATRGFTEQQPPSSSPFMSKLGDMMKHFLTKFWIWIVAIMLFVIGISGMRMTIFRIVYMALFLIFVLTFQLSYGAWRKIMYGFWAVVIGYSMSILVLVYTYQFEACRENWLKLGVSVTLQADIGLEKFETGQLFIRLLTPTFFVVITVIQMHYFHKDFLAISDIRVRASSGPKRDSSTYKSEGSSSAAGGQETEEELEEEPPNYQEVTNLPSIRDLKHWSSADLWKLWSAFLRHVEEIIELVWLFLELHMPKIMLFSVMLLCVYDVCAVHYILLLLIVVGICFGRGTQLIIIHICSILASTLLLAKMIYQIKYIQHNIYDVNCTDILLPNMSNQELTEDRTNFTVNNVDWFGLHKVTGDQTLSELVKGYIGLILVATLLAVVNVRQKYKRHLRGHSTRRPYFMFPHIKRVDADKDLKSCIKYFFNYGFYKFGIEICLMATVALIGSRMDFYAVLYCFWLCLMFSMRRETLMKVWGFYQIFIVIVIVVQYALAIGLPPGLCIEYPWYTSPILRRVQDWMFLPDPLHPPATYKLVCDFILLLLVCRQSLVFRIEKRQGLDYPGGHNRDITKDIDDVNFVNPVPDHISHIRSWLDILKRGLLSGLMWITLAIVFLAGTNRVNIFSLGYLMGSFMFLWQGEDFYLRPVNMILRWWNVLIGYNVAVITIKALLQIVGCIFIERAKLYACWAVQLFGIACIKKFRDTVKDAGITDPQDCSVAREDVGLAWDGVCFGFLIMMCRLFKSHYFIHLVNETKAMTILASRGAELIEELRQKQIAEQRDREHDILEKIKLKMERIKASQQKIQGPSFKEPTNHFQEGSEHHPRHKKAKTNRDAIRSGDYYMFDEFDDDLLELERDKDEDTDDDSDEPRTDGPRRMTLSKLLTSAMKTDIEKAADEALKRSAEPPSGDGAQGAVPISRKKSSFFSAHSQISSGGPAGDSSLTSTGTRSDHMVIPSPAESFQSTKISKVDEEDEDEETVTHEKEDSHDSGGEMSRVESLVQPEPEEEEKKPRSWWHTISAYIKFAWAFVESAMVTMTRYLNRLSRDYRYVIKVLAMEKKMLKEKRGFGEGIRTGSGMIWQPLPGVSTRQGEGARGDSDPSELYQQAVNRSVRIESSQNLETPNASDSDPLKLEDEILIAGYEDINRRQGELLGVPEIRVLAPSLERGLDSDGGSGLHPLSVEEMDEKQGLRESEQPPIVRLLLALWYAIISHSELVCYFMVFLHQVKSATILSLPLPLMVFLWGTLSVPRPTKTFWVTLIAYTEVIVIVKCMFQFELIPWNQQAVSERAPFNPPRILGIERKPQYAVYDLSLLLIAFFHRFMLKSLGLWKTTYTDVQPEFEEQEGFFHLEEAPSLQKSKDSTSQSSVQHQGTSGPSNARKAPESLRHPITFGQAQVIQTQAGHRLSIAQGPEDTAAGGSGEGNHVGSRQGSPLVVVKREEQEPFAHCPRIVMMATSRYFESVVGFFQELLSSATRVTADVYAYMFMCDFFNFMVVIFGFASFGTQQGDGGVAAYLEENKVPIPFLVMLILQFALIVIDRALFLRKFILGKIIFQFFLVIGVHIWMFFILPAVTERPFNDALPPQMWYMVKCFYLLLSAYQIRSGYPTRILGNFLCKRYNMINMICFKGFMNIPFLFELRALMDWVWTDTSMTLFDWLKMEDIFAHIFEHKCARRMETEYPQPRGERKSPTVKYFMGGGILFAIIAIIWFPLVLFALGNTVGESNIPYDVTLSVRIGPYPPVYSMSAQNATIFTFTHKDWTQLGNAYKRNRIAQTFFSGYDQDDIAVAWFDRNSSTTWDISPPDQQRLIADVESSDKPIIVTMTLTVSRVSNNPAISGVASNSEEWIIEAPGKGKTNPQRQELLKMLRGDENTTSVVLQRVFPKFLKVTNRGKVVPVTQLLDGKTDKEKSLRNVSMKLFHGSYGNLKSTQEWWELTEDCQDDNYRNYLKNIPKEDCDYLVLYTFNDKAFPATLNFLSGGGIVGLYLGIVWLAGRVIRGFISGFTYRIMFTELPNVDRILQLCLDIYLVRESGELALEEDLFAKLVFLYRSPETLIKWTRPREEEEAEDGAEGNAQPMIAQ